MRIFIGFPVLVVVLCLGMLRCSHLDAPRQPQGSSGRKVSFAFNASRHGELEPCGCTFLDYGGVAREFNVLKKWRSSADRPTFNFSSGTTFLPVDGFETKRRDYYSTKSEYLVDSLNQLGQTAISPSVDDLALGVSVVGVLEKKAKFPFVSSNLFSRSANAPIFKTSAIVESRGIKILVLGVSHPVDKAYPVAADIEVRDPVASLRQAIAANTVKTDVVVLLSSVSETVRAAIARELPAVNLIFGGDRDEEVTSVIAIPEGPASLYANSMARGRGIFYLDLELNGPLTAFFNPDLEKTFVRERVQEAADLASLNSQLAKSKKAQRKALAEKKAQIEKRVAFLDTLPRSLAPGVTEYSASRESFSKEFAVPTNPLTDLVAAFKKKTREIALDSLEESVE